MYYQDRERAGEVLGDFLKTAGLQKPLVLCWPGGGVVVGSMVAQALGADLDVLLVNEIGTPGTAQAAVACVNEFGDITNIMSPEEAGVDKNYIRDNAVVALNDMRERRHEFTPELPAIDPAGREVIIVDEGIISGSTMRTAVLAVHARKPSRVITAVPVSVKATVESLRNEGIDVVTGSVVDAIRALGQCYDDFPDVSNDEMTRILLHSRMSKQAA